MQTTMHKSFSSVDFYIRMTEEAKDEKERARIIAEALEHLEQNYPNLAHTATQRDLSETELRLMKEIELVRSDMQATELRLMKEIELVRSDMQATELKLMKEIELVRSDMQATELKLMKEIELVKTDLTKDIQQVRVDLTKDIQQVRVDLTKDIQQVRVDLTKEIMKQTKVTIVTLTAIMGLFAALIRFMPVA
jgi:gas vesicle protein